MARPRIILADDHMVVREGLIRVLENDFDIVGAVGDGRALIQEALRLRPDVAVFDIGMPHLNGVEAARQLRELLPQIKLVFLTQQGGKEYVQAAFRIGASAYVIKSGAAAELITAIREALLGRFFVSPDLQKKYVDGHSTVGTTNPVDLFGGGLTPRQREVLQLVAEGKSGTEIAQVLDISIKTVEFHKARLMDELGLRTTAELTRYALEHGMLHQ